MSIGPSSILPHTSIDSGAVYHALPPAAADDDFDSELELTFDDSATDLFVVDHAVDSRIRWVYFMLGCAILLPWNGVYQHLSLRCALWS
jgi:equilibrative nucleoside transporter 1/2/3